MLARELGSLSDQPLPQTFPSPFDLEPHPLARLAARDLQRHLLSISKSDHDFFAADGGKMFGVLVVQRANAADTATSNETSGQSLAYLAAFSGMLAKDWLRDGFAPPVFDLVSRQQVLGDGEDRLRKIEEEIGALSQSPDHVALQQELAFLITQQQHALLNAKRYFQQRRENRHQRRHQLTNQHERDIRSGHKRQNCHSNNLSIVDALELQSQRDKAEFKALKRKWDKKVANAQSAFDDSDNAIDKLKKARKALSRDLQRQLFSGYRLPSYSDMGCARSKHITDFFKGALPPGGAGDCASIKLLNSCYELKLQPVCMAEFWWGASPAGGVRHHNHFYPACRGKCRPVLPHMLAGLDVQPPRYEAVADFPSAQPHVLFEDDYILVLVKPAGMLSVAGKNVSDCVESRLQARYPGLVPEKLSRLLLHRLDQATSGLMVAAKNAACHKSLHQQFERREVDKCYVAVVDGTISDNSGLVELPLRVDVDDRPRQMVCYQHGKSATTRYRVLSRTNAQTRVQLFPVTGRTHQLRVHLAHPAGLNASIAGDELYGKAADRLYLHAARLSFRHPTTGERLDFESPPAF